MDPTYRKISVRIWTPLLDKFNQRIESACLRRDTWLTKVLENELDELDTEVEVPNSDTAQQFIAARLDALPRKLVTLTLREDLVQRLDDICERKRIVRDSFFNRLFFLLAGDWKVRERLFFADDKSWFQRVLERTDFSSTAAGERLDPIREVDDPFEAMRLGIDLSRAEKKEELEKDLGIRESQTLENLPDGIYTAVLDDKIFSKVDLFGLNVYLPDWRVPGTAEHRRLDTLLDDLLADEPPSEARQP